MKKIIVSIPIMFVLLLFVISAKSQTAEKVLTITSKSEPAKALSRKGLNYFMNAETPQAYECFSEAVKLDPDFTFAQVLMCFLTRGETSKKFAQQAIKSSKDKTEGEKLFASLVNYQYGSDTVRQISEKLYKIYPDDNFIENFYVLTRLSPDETFAAEQEYIKKFPLDPWSYNTIAYYYLNKKDMVNAKKNFEKYIELYPDGWNPYDSMGEYYFDNNDMENAKKYYTKSLEMYPYSTSSLNALEKIKAATEKDKGK